MRLDPRAGPAATVQPCLRNGLDPALSLPPFEGRDAVLTATYGIVVFSILVQGLTIGRVIRWLGKKSGETRESLT